MIARFPGDQYRTATPADILEFEAATPTAYKVGDGAASRIRARYGMTSTRYHQILEALLNPDGPHLRAMLDMDAITTNQLIDRRARLHAERARLTRTQ